MLCVEEDDQLCLCAAFLGSGALLARRHRHQNRAPEPNTARIWRTYILHKNTAEAVRYKDDQVLRWSSAASSLHRTQDEESHLIVNLPLELHHEVSARPIAMRPIYSSPCHASSPRQSPSQLVHVINILCRYAFSVRQGESEIFDNMHNLVCRAMQIWNQSQDDLVRETARSAIWHIANIFPYIDWENRSLWGQYLPHALRVLQGSEGLDIEKYNLYFRVGRCLNNDRRHQDALQCLERCYRWSKDHLLEDNSFNYYHSTSLQQDTEIVDR